VAASPRTVSHPATRSLRVEAGKDPAVLYAALTRARDKLIVTYCENPSVLIEPLRPYVEWHDGIGRDRIARRLEEMFGGR
jgi:superfamily I DNA/RNA helicase